MTALYLRQNEERRKSLYLPSGKVADPNFLKEAKSELYGPSI